MNSPRTCGNRPYVASVSMTTRTNPTQTEWDFDYELLVELKQGIAAAMNWIARK